VIYAFDAEGTVLLSEGRALTGMDSVPGAAVGRSAFDLFSGEDEVHDHLRRALAGEAHGADVRLGRSGRIYRVWYTPHRDEAGAVVLVTGLSLDVTEIRLADRDLQAAIQSLDTIQNHLPIALFRVDAGGTITLARGSILPPNAQESVGQPLAEAYSRYPELVHSVERSLRGEDQTFSMSVGLRAFDIFVRALRDGEAGQGAIGIIIEVTEQRRAVAAALEANWRSRFVAEINHELRTPLNIILGFAELLTRPEFDPLTERQRRYVDNIINSGRDLLGLVNELLDVSKVRAGHIDVVRERVDSCALLEEVVERMTPAAEAKGIVLQLGRRSPRPRQATPAGSGSCSST
jgi:signal transduction histidine kinase